MHRVIQPKVPPLLLQRRPQRPVAHHQEAHIRARILHQLRRLQKVLQPLLRLEPRQRPHHLRIRRKAQLPHHRIPRHVAHRRHAHTVVNHAHPRGRHQPLRDPKIPHRLRDRHEVRRHRPNHPLHEPIRPARSRRLVRVRRKRLQHKHPHRHPRQPRRPAPHKPRHRALHADNVEPLLQHVVAQIPNDRQILQRRQLARQRQLVIHHVRQHLQALVQRIAGPVRHRNIKLIPRQHRRQLVGMLPRPTSRTGQQQQESEFSRRSRNPFCAVHKFFLRQSNPTL